MAAGRNKFGPENQPLGSGGKQPHAVARAAHIGDAQVRAAGCSFEGVEFDWFGVEAAGFMEKIANVIASPGAEQRQPLRLANWDMLAIAGDEEIGRGGG